MSLQESNSIAPSICPTEQSASAPANIGAGRCEQLCSHDAAVRPAPSEHLFSKTFARIACDILGKDAGLHLHRIIGADIICSERACYYYAAGDRTPGLDFISALLRSPQGEPFFNAFMHGCTAPWWLDQQRQLRNARKIAELELE